MRRLFRLRVVCLDQLQEGNQGGRSAPIQSVNWRCRNVRMKSMIIGILGVNSISSCSHNGRMGFSVIDRELCVDEWTMTEEPMDMGMVMETEIVDWEWEWNGFEEDILEPVSWEWEDQSSWNVFVLKRGLTIK